MIVERVYRGEKDTWAELHEGADRITLQDMIDFAKEAALDPSKVYVTPELSCWGDGQDHDRHIQMSWEHGTT